VEGLGGKEKSFVAILILRLIAIVRAADQEGGAD
jgi:hypothetical protein